MQFPLVESRSRLAFERAQQPNRAPNTLASTSLPREVSSSQSALDCLPRLKLKSLAASSVLRRRAAEMAPSAGNLRSETVTFSTENPRLVAQTVSLTVKFASDENSHVMPL
ncbi:hypothetical protein LSM04_005664 [Trypanosoma melophagium]|uniref:uncharacterized protein n=1 Tax=Trypanosoma melophagium TaxID=715481 RepID=UPI003519E67F|nr:hypothetical protein LSM04_005664 [Trypanosoma melophagium]